MRKGKKPRNGHAELWARMRYHHLKPRQWSGSLMRSQELQGSLFIKFNCVCICVLYPDSATQKDSIAFGKG